MSIMLNVQSVFQSFMRSRTGVACSASMLILGTPALVLADGDAPDQIVLSGVIRDFHERTAEGGHPDFERRPDSGFGHYAGNVAMELDENGKPVFTGNGYKVTRQWQDRFRRNIAPHMYGVNDGDTDVAGQRSHDDHGAIDSAESFAQWYRDVPGVNMSQRLDLTLIRQEDGSYVFDDREDPRFEDRRGFFPIDGELLGNSRGSSHNYHFTFELATQFTYDREANHVFQFTGDDDVWVFINGQLVIDLAGVHGAMDQVVELNRLDLEDGETYSLHFFFAERHRTESNFRITTTLELSSPSLPSVTAAFD